ncbi:uncharacterized protein PGTG_15614 [Puccinia graminis f. sp. tritici CRL 75-36-700-3]|uniref:CCHC-type domain-containing protein n=1 Tax=Puccinia graminis f. sp. tritici (strain CRL 75-36-700-3 / race SCCL) TaxID=418459 RepID=E3KZC6_PUCGT|nr:uncharacterized protein PGTG_15614 [Puccinia graminis f. sp. tritici CRL 75-36-700-3]EFP89651.2 hypothetical protein PGTG_15614 [Puccinia graminis f. sp. tritici CRL 75-36-700-3]
MVPLTRSPIRTRAAANQSHNRSPSGSDVMPDDLIPPNHEVPPHRELSSNSRAADDPRFRAMVIKEANTRFPPEDRLKEDGSNFQIWLRDVQEFALMTFDDDMYFEADHSHDPMDCVAKAALLLSLHRSIKADLYELSSSFSIMAQIKRRFTTFSCAAQLNKWANLFAIPFDPTTNASSVAAFFRHQIHSLSLILHASISHGTELRQEFDMSINRKLSVRRDIPMSFNDYFNVLSSCRERVRARDAGRHCEPLPSGFASHAHDAQHDIRAASVESHPDNVYVLDGRPSGFKTPTPQSRSCFCCGSSSHLISQCNIAPSNPTTGHPPRQSHHPPGPQPPVAQYQAYYPILAPPFHPYHNAYHHRGAAAPPAPLQPADSYRPSYRSNVNTHRPSAREADATMTDPNAVDASTAAPSFSDLTFSATPEGTPSDALFDTGATHHLTGDREGHPDFSWAELNSGES